MTFKSDKQRKAVMAKYNEFAHNRSDNYIIPEYIVDISNLTPNQRRRYYTKRGEGLRHRRAIDKVLWGDAYYTDKLNTYHLG